ncbi:MAG: hypothetical protein IJ757_06150 [Clostridiales bacterium]|nr:hypothetical protein [Clostridiales bacterium]
MELSDNKKREYVKRLLLSRMRILTRNGFYGQLLMHMEFALDEKCDTAATNGTKIIFGPGFLDKLDDGELDFVMMHEVLHVALQHCGRTGERDNELFNVACDIVVNSNILQSCGMNRASITLSGFGESMHIAPDGREGYEYTAEQVYEMMLKRGSGMNSGATSKIPSGGGWDDHTLWDGACSDNLSRDMWKQRVISAAENMKLRGSIESGRLPMGIERILKELRRPQTDWRTLLNDFVQEEITDYSFSPPDRRFGDSPFFLPDYNDKDEVVKDILFMIDASGSVSDDMMTTAYSEVAGAIDQFGGKLRGWLGFFDAVVSEVTPFDSLDSFKLIKPTGGGGTSFKAVFDYVSSLASAESTGGDGLPSCIIILTDGYAPYPPEADALGIPVLWLMSTSVTPPWGRVARIEM